MIKYPAGSAMIVPRKTGFSKSFDNSITMFSNGSAKRFLAQMNSVRLIAV